MGIKSDSAFEILCFRDLSYEKMTVEIQYKEEQIAQINQDKGVNQLEIELFTEFVEQNFTPKFMLDDFLFTLNEAKKFL